MSAALALGEHGYERLVSADLVRTLGKVTRILGLAIEATGVKASMGELCEIRSQHRRLLAEVVGFRDDRLLLMPLDDLIGVYPDSEVSAVGRPQSVSVGPGQLGRVID